jgi:hypothetical protein
MYQGGDDRASRPPRPPWAQPTNNAFLSSALLSMPPSLPSLRTGQYDRRYAHLTPPLTDHPSEPQKKFQRSISSIPATSSSPSALIPDTDCLWGFFSFSTGGGAGTSIDVGGDAALVDAGLELSAVVVVGGWAFELEPELATTCDKEGVPSPSTSAPDPAPTPLASGILEVGSVGEVTGEGNLNSLFIDPRRDLRLDSFDVPSGAPLLLPLPS